MAESGAEVQQGQQSSGASGSNDLTAAANPDPEQRCPVAVRREQIIGHAKLDGVEYPAELLQMGIEDLEAWARDHLL